jgi:hypothetical protein
MSRILKTALSAALLYLVSTVSALATDAKATAWLNVRSGPGSSYAVVDTMAPGEVGNLTECQSNGWCFIQRSGPDGWVSSSYLTAAEEPSDPNCRFALTVGPGGPRFTIICGDGAGSVVVPVPVPSPNRVCFFDGANYTGTRFCRQPGVYNTMPAGFNNKISSVRLHGNARVRICDLPNMGPFCRTMTASDPNLGGMLNNQVSSFRVYTGMLPPLKQVCLFDGPNYSGARYCLRTGQVTLPVFARNKATSVYLYGGARIRLSKNVTYGVGPAQNITGNVPMLPPAWNNQTKSVWVY